MGPFLLLKFSYTENIRRVQMSEVTTEATIYSLQLLFTPMHNQ